MKCRWKRISRQASPSSVTALQHSCGVVLCAAYMFSCALSFSSALRGTSCVSGCRGGRQHHGAEWERALSCLSMRTSTTTFRSPLESKKNNEEFHYFEYDGYTISYRFRPAAPGFEAVAPLLLIHPIGIGLASWFWTRFMDDWKGGAVYAVNLSENGMFFPLSWVKQCETFIETVILPEQRKLVRSGPLAKLGRLTGSSNPYPSQMEELPGVTVMSQGGLAPVAILVAARNKCGHVKHMILSAPPADSEILRAVPVNELKFNFDFLSGPLGQLAFQYALETEWAVRFFSNLFLFDKPCEEEWVEAALKEAGPGVRIPVCCFNAGFCQHRSYEPELTDISIPCLILQGKADKRHRTKYKELIGDDRCQIVTVSGQNVLPWESPTETASSIQTFLGLV
jgi:hypothetical protein